MLDDKLPILSVGLNHLAELVVLGLAPHDFGPALQPSIPAITHFAIPALHFFSDFRPVPLLFVPQPQQLCVLSLSPNLLLDLVPSFPEIIQCYV